MSFEIVSLLAQFKNTLINDNRYFISNEPFLLKFKEIIEQDALSEHPLLVTILPTDSILYRARVVNDRNDNSRHYAKEMMKQCGNEHYGIAVCEKCEETSTCTAIKSTQENADYFRKAAKQDFLSSPLSKNEQGFNGYGKKDSSRPPKEKSDYISDMRANPKYIRYLYAAKEKYTAMLETRPNIGSFVSVANIKTLSPLNFFDITNAGENTSEDMSLLLFELNNVFSTPVNGELKDYLLSQVLSEYIKCFDNATRFDGICYMSSMNSMGKNYVIFGEDKCIPVSSEVYYISEIGLTAYSVTEEDEIIIDNTNRI